MGSAGSFFRSVLTTSLLQDRGRQGAWQKHGWPGRRPPYCTRRPDPRHLVLTPHVCAPLVKSGAFFVLIYLRESQGDTQHAEPRGLSLCTQQGGVEPSGVPEGSFQALHAKRVQMSVPGQQECGRGSSVSPKGDLGSSWGPSRGL